MKNAFAFLILVLSVTSAQAGWDGCYMVYEKGAQGNTICLQGTEEEGINGSGVRLYDFGVSDMKPRICALGSVTKMTATDLVYEKDGIKEFVILNFNQKQNAGEVDIDGFGKRMKIAKHDDEITRRFLENTFNVKCK